MIRNTHTITKEEYKQINIPLLITDNDQTNKFDYLPDEDNNDIRIFESQTHYSNFSIILNFTTPFGK